jgi:hypothetical protein
MGCHARPLKERTWTNDDPLVQDARTFGISTNTNSSSPGPKKASLAKPRGRASLFFFHHHHHHLFSFVSFFASGPFLQYTFLIISPRCRCASAGLGAHTRRREALKCKRQKHSLSNPAAENGRFLAMR